MGKVQRLEKELDFLKEKYKNYFLVLFALLSGEATIIYSVTTGDKPIYTLFLGIIVIVFIAILTGKIKNIENYIEDKLEELGETE